MKKEILFIIIGIISAFALGFVIRGILSPPLPEEIVVTPPPIIDEAQIRAEIEQNIRAQLKKEIDAKVLQRLRYTLGHYIVNQDLPVGRWVMGGEIVDINEEEQKVKVKMMNTLGVFRGENFTDFIFNQPYYFIKTVAITADTIIVGHKDLDPLLKFQDINLGLRVGIVATQPFVVGTQEILVATDVLVFPE
jgi:hypothetical protein